MSWSDKYKRSINCDNPSGFSQKAHCAARKKRAKGEETKSKSPFNEMNDPRIPKKPGQPDKSDKHSDLYTDEDPKGTIHGLGFKDVATAKQSVSKIKNSGRSHAHKIQAAIAMEQRARVMRKTSEAAIFRKFINSMKKKTEEMNEEKNKNRCKPGNYYCYTDKKCKPIPTGYVIGRDGMLDKEDDSEGNGSNGNGNGSSISEEGLRDWFGKSKSKGGKRGWVNVVTGGTCASDEPGEGVPKCVSSSKRASMTKAERLSAARRKKKADPGQQQKSGAARPTYVSTDSPRKKRKKMKEEFDLQEAKDKPGKGSGTKDACYHKVKSRYSVWPSAYASGALVKCRRVGAANWGNKSESIDIKSRDPLSEAIGMIRYCPKCEKNETREECRYGPKFWDTYSLPMNLGKKYTPNTPHPGNMPEGYDHEYSMARSELSTIISAAKRLRKKMKGEGNIEAWVQSKITKAADYLDTAADYVDSGEMKEQVSDTSIPADEKNIERFSVAIKSTGRRNLPNDQKINALRQAAQIYRGVREEVSFTIPNAKPTYKYPILPQEKGDEVPIQLIKKIKKPGVKLPLAKKETKTQVAHFEPEGEVIDEKCWPGYKKKGMKTMFGKRYPNCVKAEGFSNWRAEMGLSEDWQKVNRKDKTDGLSPAAVKAYRRENPGSKLKTAVTEKNPTGKRASRRKSFCSRMGGMKKKLTSAKTARDPDSRINKALRRWNCN